MTKRLRLAGVCLLAGFGVELATLQFVHPISFMAFAGVGGALIAAGIVIYLLAVLRQSEGSRSPEVS